MNFEIRNGDVLEENALLTRSKSTRRRGRSSTTSTTNESFCLCDFQLPRNAR
jgi:hypothetical protein